MELIEERIHLIAKEIQEANASPWTITRIIKVLGEMNTKSEKKLREKAIEMLKELDPNTAAIYERFSRMRVYTTNEKEEPFNRGQIIKSLLKETNIPRSVAEKITIEVEDQIKDAKINFLTTGLIREMVSAKLISYGLEKIRNSYTRLGEPFFEIKKKLDENAYSGEQVREYNTLCLPEKARKMHYNGIIHIEDIEGFSHRPFAYTFIAEKKESVEDTICAAVKKLVDTRKYFYQPPNIYGLTFACAPFVKNEIQAKKIAFMIKQAMQIPMQGFSFSIELYTPTELQQFSDYRLNASQLGNNLMDLDNVVINVDSKYALKLIQTEGKRFNILNSSEEDYYPLNGSFFSTQKGIDLFVNINLQRFPTDETDFFDELKNVAEQINLLREEKKKNIFQKKYNSFFKGNELSGAIGITSIFEATQRYCEEKNLEEAKKIHKMLTKLFPDYLIFGLSSEDVRKRFSEFSKKEVFSQNIMEFDECLSSKKCCLTGKATSIKEVNELLDKKVKQIEFLG